MHLSQSELSAASLDLLPSDLHQRILRAGYRMKSTHSTSPSKEQELIGR